MNLQKLNIFKNLADKCKESQRQEGIAEINSDIQIREFGGKLFFAYSNLPLIEVDNLNKDICVILEQARENVIKYKSLDK